MKFLVVSVIFYLAVASALPAKKSPSATRKSTQNIPESLTTFGLTTLAESVAKAGLVETLSGPGPFTVFAPTNDAFTNVDPATMKALQMDAALFKRVLTHHVVASNIESVDIKNELTSKSVAGDSLRLNVYKVGDKTVTTVNGATKIRAIETTNGVIYVIDKVLVPNDEASIVKVLEKQGTFSTLLTALKVADLTSTLDSPVPLTLFAPTDDAFRALPAGALDSLIAKPDELKKVLLAHVVSGTVYSKGLSAGSVPVVSGRTVEVTIGKSGVTVSNAQVTEADLPASNGVVHVISSVILLPTTLPAAAAPAVVVAKEAAPAAPAPIAEKPVVPAPIAAAPVVPKIAAIPPVAAPVPVAVAAPAPIPAVAPAAPKQTPAGSLKPAPAPKIIPEVLAANGLTTLVDSVVKAGLADALSGKGPFTVFAPTNDAFDAVDPAVMKSLQMDVNLLKRVLTYHVVASAVAPSDVKNELVAKTLAGESLRVNVYGTGDKAITTINGALRMRTIEAANGIIYVIDKVLVPEKEDLNIVKILEKEGRFATLLTALKVAGLTDTVASPGPFTLFAPTDGAFRSLPEGALDSLIAKPEELKKVLLNHVVSGTVYSRGLVSGDVPVVGGGAVPAVVAKSGVSVANSQVIDADLAASNGVVHVINSVILSSSPTAAVKAAESTPVRSV
jgi:transforming growth factor-beta-induced protein